MVIQDRYIYQVQDLYQSLFEPSTLKLNLVMSTLDIKTSRDCFPALKQPQVFFDNAGGSQTLGTVIEEYVSNLSRT